MSRIDFPKIYNPANQSREELIDAFVVRTALFREIFEDIKTAKMDHPEQHYIIQGMRGQGKTTLLLRIAYEIENDPELRARVIPVVFNEEQYHISRLFKLWESTAEYLEEMGEIQGLAAEMAQMDFDDDFEMRCFQLLQHALNQRQKKLILFIDNIDVLLTRFSKREHQRLREVFMESAELRVIGASSASLEFHYDYGQPFYQFFKMPQLRGLTNAETRTLLLKLGECYSRGRVEEIIKTQPGRIEALRRLTGGVIRTLVLLFDIFVDDTAGNAFFDLEKILDSVTPLYKHRMDALSSQQQEIVDFVALKWDAVSVREIAQKIRLESKAISAQLQQLEHYHIIEKERTTTKNYLYRISERFFNIWYLMRLGRKWDARRVRFLVEFLQIWCDRQELETRAQRHFATLQQGKVYDKHAFYLTEALARTPLPREMQHELLAKTRTYLEQEQSELFDCLSCSDQDLSEKTRQALASGDTAAAIESLEQIKQKTAEELNQLGKLFRQSGDFAKAAQYYLQAVAKDHAGAMNNLANLYRFEFKDFAKAEQYYLQAVAKGDAGAMNNLALLYKNEFKDIGKAEQYYLQAVAKDHAGAMFNLALLYKNEFKDFAKAEKYYLQAVAKDHAGAMNNLANLYHTEIKDFAKAEHYYLQAVAKDHTDAMNNLANLYRFEFKDFAKAEQYYLQAVAKDNANAMNNLALLYKNEIKDFAKAEQYYLQAVAKGDAGAMNNLAYHYFKLKTNPDQALQLIEKSVQIQKDIFSLGTFAVILLWHNQIERALPVIQEWLAFEDVSEKYPDDVQELLLLLLAKKQYHFVQKLFEENPHHLKDRFKPVYYALMFFLQDAHPNEFRKMGGELKQTVEEIIEAVRQLEQDYA
jgi:TPR repeat protein